MDRKSRIPAPVGGASLLVIFAVLCLSVFSMLVLSTVKADERLSEASLKATASYYEADREAERILSQLRAGVVEDGVSSDGGIYTYEVPAGDTQALHVVVRVEGSSYQVEEWRLLSTQEWVPDEHIELFDIEDLEG